MISTSGSKYRRFENLNGRAFQLKLSQEIESKYANGAIASQAKNF